MNNKTCKDCPCKEDVLLVYQYEHDEEVKARHRWNDMYAETIECHLDPDGAMKRPDDWCYRGREIMERSS